MHNSDCVMIAGKLAYCQPFNSRRRWEFKLYLVRDVRPLRNSVVTTQNSIREVPLACVCPQRWQILDQFLTRPMPPKKRLRPLPGQKAIPFYTKGKWFYFFSRSRKHTWHSRRPKEAGSNWHPRPATVTHRRPQPDISSHMAAVWLHQPLPHWFWIKNKCNWFWKMTLLKCKFCWEIYLVFYLVTIFVSMEGWAP